MKVMIIIDTVYLSGPGKGVLQLLQHDKSQQYTYIVCAFNYRNPKSTQFIDSARAAGHDVRLLTQRFRFDPKAIFEALIIARSEQVNLLQTHGYKGHVIALVLSKKLSIPWFAMTHGWTWQDKKVLLYNKFERWLLKRADIAATVSSPLFQEIKKLRGPEYDTRLIFNSVDEKQISGDIGGEAIREQYNISSEKMLLGVFGRMSPEKGVLLMLEAFRELNRQLPDVQLIYVGVGPQRTALEKVIADFNLTDRVILAGHQVKMRDYYEAIDLLIIPSLSEGLPNVLLEAMVLGVPVISTSVGAIPEVIQHGQNGWLVPPDNTDALAEQLVSVLKVPEKMRQIGIAGQESIYPRFIPSERACKFKSIYSKLLGKK
ncbi:MAG: glycosyltransferase family 4 protein [Pirellulales bacterium]